MRAGHNPVMPVDLLVGAGGGLILIGLGLEWSDGASGYGSLSVLKALFAIVGLAALLEPLVLFLTRKTDLPVVWQAILLLAGSVLSAIMVGKAVLPPDGGFGTGFYLALAGILLSTLGIWITVSREK